VMPRLRVLKAAYLEMLKSASDKGWPKQVESILVQRGLSHMGDGIGLQDLRDQVS